MCAPYRSKFNISPPPPPPLHPRLSAPSKKRHLLIEMSVPGANWFTQPCPQGLLLSFSSNRRNLKTAALPFDVDGKRLKIKLSENEVTIITIFSLPEFYSTSDIQNDLASRWLLRFQISSALCGWKMFDPFLEWNIRFQIPLRNVYGIALISQIPQKRWQEFTFWTKKDAEKL